MDLLMRGSLRTKEPAGPPEEPEEPPADEDPSGSEGGDTVVGSNSSLEDDDENEIQEDDDSDDGDEVGPGRFLRGANWGPFKVAPVKKDGKFACWGVTCNLHTNQWEDHSLLCIRLLRHFTS